MTGDAIVITAELPGVNRDDVYVGVKNNVLTLKGERSVEEVMRDESRAHRQHCSGTFRRAFILPETVEPDHIKAEFNSGILNVEILRTKK
jgi:HSP20 family protein